MQDRKKDKQAAAERGLWEYYFSFAERDRGVVGGGWWVMREVG